MHEQRVEVVEIAAFLEEAFSYVPDLRVALEKGVAERVKEAYEGELDLGVGVVDSRVEKSGYAITLRQHVGAPYVAVDEGGPFGLSEIVVEPLSQFFCPLQILGWQTVGLVSYLSEIK